MGKVVSLFFKRFRKPGEKIEFLPYRILENGWEYIVDLNVATLYLHTS